MDNLQDLEGHFIPRRFRAGYIVLSYFISFVGSWTTLEIINRRTSMRGAYNWLHLAAASISMGGIAIWCMHFIGNRAIVLGEGQRQLQIAYSSGFTALSFFLPVIVLFMAFWAVGSNERISIVRVILGSILAGFGICGMHYLGQAGISNYDCVYTVAYVIGAGAIAVGASAGALGIFFLFRSSWDTSWWKRIISANVLGVAVSGMHWLASVGTQYRLRVVDSTLINSFSSTSTVIVVIVLSISACFTLLVFTLLAQRRILKSAKRAQQVVLATAIFDHEGKLLVTPEGRLPTQKITNAWLERSLNDVFNTSHAVFLWIFRTSRNWSGVGNLIPGMRLHVHRAGIKGRLGSKADSNLLNDEGIPIEDYSLVFRELFCVAAADLAADLNQPLDNMGVLYDEIISTGNPPKTAKNAKSKQSEITVTSSLQDVERDAGHSSVGRGQLLFLVNRVGRKEADRLQAAGFRFATPAYVVPIIAQSLQTGPHTLARRLNIMRDYAYEPHMLDEGVHLACFAIRASLGAGRHGFEVLARKDAKNQLPTMQIPIESLEDWQYDYLKKMDTMTVSASIKLLFKAAKPNNPSPKEQKFAKQLLTTLEALKDEIEDPFFNDAMLIAKPVDAPCRGHGEDSPPGTALLITFKIIVPIHSRAPGKKLTFVPLNFFKTQQHVYKNSPDHGVFARKTYREFSPFLDLYNPNSPIGRSSGGSNLIPNKLTASSTRKSRHEAMMGDNLDMYGNPVDQSQEPDRGPSKIRFWDKASKSKQRLRGDNSSEKGLVDVASTESRTLGGIMVSQDISVDVGTESQGNPNSRSSSPLKKGDPMIEMKEFGKNPKSGIISKIGKEEEESATFVDALFTTTITTRQM
ncbi:uncharacterized protein LY89DRAFT_221723 [Mollisia scopiformis]|uniref:MHYT domain-containing protein n=1 Tax=Mollisia scopiformis TaxID=149040 RepID=A0A194WWM8_MOLSC|nr:uncharacterized protein LY89DRAFT_221723 [Mollisia scopiformis]KUJ12089.1 hypothetical protein LY89DRAFT_221723 [Mollisia scopiformis]